MIDNDRCILPVIRTHIRHSDLKGRRMEIDLRSLTSLMTLSSTSFVYRLPFFHCPFFNPSIPCGFIPHPAVPRSAKAPITLPTLSDTVVLSMSFEDALFDPLSHQPLRIDAYERGSVLVLIVFDSDGHIESPALYFRRPALFPRQRRT